MKVHWHVCVQVYLPPVEKDQLLADVRKPAYVTKALQAVFDDRCLGYLEKDVTMRTLKDLVKRKKQNKLVVEGEDASSVMQLVIRYALLTVMMHMLCFVPSLCRVARHHWTPFARLHVHGVS